MTELGTSNPPVQRNYDLAIRSSTVVINKCLDETQDQGNSIRDQDQGNNPQNQDSENTSSRLSVDETAFRCLPSLL